MNLSDKLINEIAKYLNCSIEIVTLYLCILESPKYSDDLMEKSPNSSNIETHTQLETLCSLCLISDYIGRDRKVLFFPIDPQFSFPSILLTEMWAVDANLHTVEDLLGRPELTYLNCKYKGCMNIVKNVKGLYQKQLPFLKEAAVVIKGYKRIATYISELLETADKEIFAVVSPPHLLGEIIWQTVVEKMNTGITYQRVTTFDELVRHGYAIYKNEITNHNEKLFITKTNCLSHKFYVINNITVVFFIPDIQSKGFKLEAQIINNLDFANRYIGVYHQLQEQSYDLTVLIRYITIQREKFIKKAEVILEKDELEWLIAVFDLGVFCKHDEYSPVLVESAKKKCIENKLVSITEHNEILANYNLQEVMNNAE